MKSVVATGYPKSGNTLLGQTLNIAGNVSPHHEINFGIYGLRAKNITPPANDLFDEITCTLKSHEMFKSLQEFQDFHFGNVIKVITICRNPLDTLLSSLNYFRVIYYNKSKLSQELKESLLSLIPDYTVNKSFARDFTLENLRSEGFLDIALENFGKNGTIIPHFYKMSGAWKSFYTSFEKCNIPTLKIRYEDLITVAGDLSSKTSNIDSIKSLSDFLQVDPELLLKGFQLQRENAIRQGQKGRIFYNKLSDGYWKNYFSLRTVRSFVEQYKHEISSCGYPELVENILT